MMDKVLVTGAGGYMGRFVVNALLDKGVNVIATDINANGVDTRAQIICEDIFSESPDIYVKLGCPDICLHLAWRDGFMHHSNAHMENLSYHARFIRQMAEGGLKHIAVMGTMHEIGYYEGAVREDTPCNPITPYGIAKDALRRYTLMLGSSTGIIVQWLRAFYIYGDDMRSNSIFAKLLKAEAEGRELFPFTSGKNKYDFISVSELAQQISACVTQKEVTGIINCCSGIPVSLGEQIEHFIKDHGMKIALQYGVYPERAYDSPAIWGDRSRIQQILEAHKGSCE